LVEIKMSWDVCVFVFRFKVFGFQLSSLLHVGLSVCCLPTPFYTASTAAAPKS